MTDSQFQKLQAWVGYWGCLILMQIMREHWIAWLYVVGMVVFAVGYFFIERAAAREGQP